MPLHKNLLSLLAAVLLGISCVSLADQPECDCTETVGTCTATVRVVQDQSSSGLHGADLLFNVPAHACAKIEYYVDGLPALALTRNGRTVERVLATDPKPITAKRITIDRCLVCKTAAQVQAEQAEKEQLIQQEVDKVVSQAINSSRLHPPTKSDPDPSVDAVMSIQQRLGQSQQSTRKAHSNCFEGIYCLK